MITLTFTHETDYNILLANLGIAWDIGSYRLYKEKLEGCSSWHCINSEII